MRAPTGESGLYRVAFEGVDSSDDFIRLAGYLQKLSVVRRITPTRATPQALEYELELVSGLPGLNRLLARDLPQLPLPDCTTPEACCCRFREWPDRRIGERRFESAAQQRAREERARDRRARQERRSPR